MGLGGGEAILYQGWDPFQVTPTLMGARLLLVYPVTWEAHCLLDAHLSLGLCWEQVLWCRNATSSTPTRVGHQCMSRSMWGQIQDPAE